MWTCHSQAWIRNSNWQQTENCTFACLFHGVICHVFQYPLLAWENIIVEVIYKIRAKATMHIYFSFPSVYAKCHYVKVKEAMPAGQTDNKSQKQVWKSNKDYIYGLFPLLFLQDTRSITCQSNDVKAAKENIYQIFPLLFFNLGDTCSEASESK